MSNDETMSAGEKAARTRKQRAAARKAVKKKKQMNARTLAIAAEAASKAALQEYCKEHGWRVAFFEGESGAPRTGIIDAIAFRLGRKNADLLDMRLVQLKGGHSGTSGPEITRLKAAAANAKVGWLIAEFDGVTKTLHLLPDDPIFP